MEFSNIFKFHSILERFIQSKEIFRSMLLKEKRKSAKTKTIHDSWSSQTIQALDKIKLLV